MTTITDDRRRIAETIRQQIGPMRLATLGASNLALAAQRYDGHDQYGLAFDARIIPMRNDGTRAIRPRKMRVVITLNPWDYYDLRVIYVGSHGVVEHYAARHLDVERLQTMLYALDWDGDQVLNPRYL